MSDGPSIPVEHSSSGSKYEQSISSSIRRISRSIDQYSHQLARVYGLTAPQLVCLRYLVQHGPSMSSALARYVALSQATVTGILDRLESRGMITRTRDHADRRAVILEATEVGRDLVEGAPSSLHASFSNQLARLHEGEQALFDLVLRRIAEMMEDSTVDPTESASADG